MRNSPDQPQRRNQALTPDPVCSQSYQLVAQIIRISQDDKRSPLHRAQKLIEIWNKTKRQLKEEPAVIVHMAQWMGKIGREDPAVRRDPRTHSFMAEVAHAAKGQLRYFQPREFAQITLAFAYLNLNHSNLFEALQKATREKMCLLDFQSLGNTAWAWATLGIRNEGFFNALANEFMLRLARAPQPQALEIAPLNLVNIAWAFATLEIENTDLFHAVARCMIPKISAFSAQNISNTAWAFASAGILHDELFGALARQAIEKAPEFTSQGIANTAWAYATLRIRDEELFNTLGHHSSKKLDNLYNGGAEIKPQELANIAWAFAVLDVGHTELFCSCADLATRSNSTINLSDRSLLAWSTTLHFPELVPAFIDPSVLAHGDLDDVSWLQCYQALLATGLIEPSQTFSRYESIVRSFRTETLNSFERQVEKALRGQFQDGQYTLQFGHIVAGIATDFLLEYSGRRIIIECDGDKFHRSTGPNGGIPLGNDRLQDSLLTLHGYEVVHIRDSEVISPNIQSILRSKLRL
jgi:very-short-patch-repair endonuclease